MKLIPIDIETTGLSFKRDRILGVGIGGQYLPEGASFILPETACYQNGHFDIKFLNQYAGDTRFTKGYAFDTMLAASVLINRPPSLSLDSLAEHYLGMESWKDDTNKMFKEKNWVQKLEADPERQRALRERNLRDLIATQQLSERLLKHLEHEGMTGFFFDKIMPAARLLTDTEFRGMRLDLEKTQKVKESTQIRIEELKALLNEWSAPAVLNWNSPKQLSVFLKGRGYNLETYDFRTRKSVESTGVATLKSLLPNPNISLLLEYRGATKLLVYLEGWIEDQFEGRIYPTYNMASTRTGRLSCSNPNMQQIPREKEIRSLFIPSEGKKYLIADFSQIEIRVVAHYSKDPTLLQVFTEGLDFYGSIANKVLKVPGDPNDVKRDYPKLRQVAKVIGLSILYGIGAGKLSSILKNQAGYEMDPLGCKIIIEEYFKSYPGLLKFRQYVEERVMSDEPLETHYGRKFKIDPERVFSTGVNTVVQSTASDACLFSQIEIDRRLAEMQIEAPLVAIIHDEVIREVSPEHAITVGKLMEEVMCNQGLICPLKLDWVVGNSWGDKTA